MLNASTFLEESSVRQILMAVGVVVLLTAGYSSTRYAFSTVGVSAPDEIIAPNEPVQVYLEDVDVIRIPGGALTPVASFDAEVRVLLKTKYKMDGFASIAPYDLGVSWGPMSHNDNVDRYDFFHRSRFLVWYPNDTVTRADMVLDQNQMANFHLIPADDEVEKQIAAARPGQLMELKGYLVNVKMDDGYRVKSSTTRDDTGAGACEVIYVESAYAMSIR